jgi:hypothetical protein
MDQLEWVCRGGIRGMAEQRADIFLHFFKKKMFELAGIFSEDLEYQASAISRLPVCGV